MKATLEIMADLLGNGQHVFFIPDLPSCKTVETETMNEQQDDRCVWNRSFDSEKTDVVYLGEEDTKGSGKKHGKIGSTRCCSRF